MNLSHLGTRAGTGVIGSALLMALLFAAPSMAGAPELIVNSDLGTAGATIASGVCTLEPGPVNTVMSQVYSGDPWTAVATRLHLTSCTSCPAPSLLLLNDVSFRIRWLEAGNGTAEVSIIGATDAGGCLAPDPSQVLCGPESYPISSAGAGGVVYTLPLPTGCCVQGEAFVLVRFVFPAGSTIPLSVASATCVACEQYFTTQTGFLTFTDYCSASSTPLWFSVGADCCQPTPTERRTWGTVKALYR